LARVQRLLDPEVDRDLVIRLPPLVADETAQAGGKVADQRGVALLQRVVITLGNRDDEEARGKPVALAIHHYGVLGLLLQHLVDLGRDNFATEYPREAVIQAPLQCAIQFAKFSERSIDIFLPWTSRPSNQRGRDG